MTLFALSGRFLAAVVLLVSACCSFSTLRAQPGGYTTTDRSAIKKYESGVECMRTRKMECAMSEFTKAAQADERFAGATADVG